jgi:hypothetical protein
MLEMVTSAVVSTSVDASEPMVLDLLSPPKDLLETVHRTLLEALTQESYALLVPDVLAAASLS